MQSHLSFTGANKYKYPINLQPACLQPTPIDDAKQKMLQVNVDHMIMEVGLGREEWGGGVGVVLGGRGG